MCCEAFVLKNDGSIALAAILMLPLALSLLSLRLAPVRDENYQTAQWIRHLRLLRVVPLFTVAMWWSLWDNFPQSDVLTALLHFCPRWACFLLAPALAVAVARAILYSIDRRTFARRLTNADIVRLTIWSTIARTVPLLMLAAGINALPHQHVAGFSWLAGAAVVALIGTLRLHSAEGFKPRSVKTGELHKRAFVIAKRMGVPLRRVYVVPTGRSHLTNAFGGLFKTIGVSDDYGKWLKGSQPDFVLGHELAHIQQNHLLQKLSSLLSLFSLMAAIGLRLPHLSPAVRTIFPFVAVFVPLIPLYSVSRRFEYAADRAATEVTNDAAAAIQALASLYRHTQDPAHCNRFVELFSTHPALSRRVQAIARSHQLTAERLSSLV